MRRRLDCLYSIELPFLVWLFSHVVHILSFISLLYYHQFVFYFYFHSYPSSLHFGSTSSHLRLFVHIFLLKRILHLYTLHWIFLNSCYVIIYHKDIITVIVTIIIFSTTKWFIKIYECHKYSFLNLIQSLFIYSKYFGIRNTLS